MKKLNSLLCVMAVATCANAQTTLPRAVCTIDFEGVTSAADLKAEQVGEGAFPTSSDANFGTYYQNKPTVKQWGRHANYLIVPVDGFQKAGSKATGEFTLTFWVNGYVANANMQTVNHYYSSLISAYGANSYKTWSWPVFNVRTRGNLQINCDGWSDYTNTENVNGVVKEDNSWILTTQTESGETDEEGNPIMVDTDFDANWHYIAIVFSGVNAKYYIDGNIWNEWNATNNNYAFPYHMKPLDALYLGDGTCWDWNDPDGAYAFDDINFYATALSADQIDLIMNIKHGNIGDEERLALAQAQLQTTIDTASEFQAMLSDEGFASMADAYGDYLMEIDPYSYDDVDLINNKIAEINNKQDTYNAVVEAYNAAQQTIDNYTDYCANTAFNGADDFNEAISTATEAIADPTSSETIAAAMTTLEAAKTNYIFSQQGDVINVSKVISAPWFVEEAYEPTLAEDGTPTFPEGAGSHLSTQGWTIGCSENLRGASDCTVYFTNGRTTANVWHNSTVTDGLLYVQQTLSGLPAGYYELSADMSSSSEPTDNHLYAISGGITRVSETPASFGPWVQGDDTSGSWTTLTTDKVLVGSDGTLTIGASSTTDGTQYKGWFCVTNFQLKYYGTAYDMSEDVNLKADEVHEAIKQLTLAGDRTNAEAALEKILASNAIDYLKVAELTDLLKDINSIYATETAFTADKAIQTLRDQESEETVKRVYTLAATTLQNALQSETATVDILPQLQTLYTAYTQLADITRAALTWGTDDAIAAAQTATDNLTPDDSQSVLDKAENITDIMKASITQFEASDENPKDITALIGNPSFDNDLHDAWTIQGGYTIQQAEIEFYNVNFNLTQTITHMPAGKYMLTVSGFYRDGNDYAAILSNYHTKLDEDTDSTYYDLRANATLYATAGTRHIGSSLISIASDSLTIGAEDDDSYYDYYGNLNHVSTDFTSLDKSADPAIYYPYWMWNAYDMITNRNLYQGNQLTINLVKETDLVIGVQKQSTINGDWTLIDNFRLYYLGASEEQPITVDDITTLIDQYLDGSYGIQLTDITDLIDQFLEQ
ncbi:MAG: hypothetical protein IJT97_06500 [Bacteroidaceae bacterium]|nr:hypothetical protein [Bacteroidaceae bacterium]